MAAKAGGRVVASDHQIQLRRRQDATLATAQAGVDEDRKLRQVASFEIHTHRRIEANRVLRGIDRVQARHDETLELRRKRLAVKLADEQAKYDAELSSMAETQEERRDRIAQRAVELRNERERLRQTLAQQQRERAFRAGCPPLREANSRAIQLKVAVDREEQLNWNKQRKAHTEHAERVFDELWEEDRQAKEARARADLARKREMDERLRANLALQADCRAQHKKAMAEQQRLDDEEFRQRCQRGLDEDAEADRQRRLKQRDFAAKNKEYNEVLGKIKDEERQRELDQDRQFLNDLVEKVRADEDKERAAKRQMREEAVHNMREIEQQMKRQAGAETELDRLWQEENDKEWTKREGRWRAEQQARDDLLRETYKGRGEQVDQKREAMRVKRKADADEQQRMLDDVQRMQAEDKAAARKRYADSKAHQSIVKSQMADKKEAANAEKRDRELDFVAAQLAERRFQESVQNELSIVTKNIPGKMAHALKLSSQRTF